MRFVPVRPPPALYMKVAWLPETFTTGLWLPMPPGRSGALLRTWPVLGRRAEKSVTQENSLDSVVDGREYSGSGVGLMALRGVERATVSRKSETA